MGQKQTAQQYDRELAACKKTFVDKAGDYGTSWRVLRPVSITDQILIKALRIRHIQETGEQKIADRIDSEFCGIVNYGIIALIQSEWPADTDWELPLEQAVKAYEQKAAAVRTLMLDKNHDYGEAWRQMSQASMVDLILSKLQRIRRILAQDGKTRVSEGMESNFADIVNYALFALIRIRETSNV